MQNDDYADDNNNGYDVGHIVVNFTLLDIHTLTYILTTF